MQIVVMQRGWVYVGKVRREGEEFVMEPAACIRRWGTPGEGLPALQRGPKEATELDLCSHPVRVHQLAVVHRLDCDPGPWEEVLGG